jgi:hypothetical protein
MTQILPFTALLLAHHNDLRLSKAVESVSCAKHVIIGWSGKRLSEREKETLQQLHSDLTLVEQSGPIVDFAQTRNLLQSYAKTEWVFWLDSDEALRTESIPVLAEVLSRQDLAGAAILRRDVFHGRELHWGEVRNVRIVRLFKHSSGTFIRPVHEVALVDGRVEELPLVISHFAHENLSFFLAKVVQYASIEAEHRYQAGKRAGTIELLAWPIGKFVHNVLIKQGWRDGWRGLSYATMMSLHSICVRVFLREKYIGKHDV